MINDIYIYTIKRQPKLKTKRKLFVRSVLNNLMEATFC